jgi:hypothetical protein
MAVKKQKTYTFAKKVHTKRKGVHSKNASRSQNAYKQPYRGQGR